MKPIIIIGAPRSGTMLLARAIGGHRSACLITEHSSKMNDVPEDRAGVLDEQLWRDCFEFRPKTDVPICDARSVRAIRDVYSAIGRGRLLVLKNPRHTLRIPLLREIFPGARFVFAARNPWHVMQSIIVSRNPNGYLLRTERTNQLPKDHLVRAAATWAESARAYAQEHDESWLLVRYEEVVSEPSALAHLLDKLGLSDDAYLSTTLKILRPPTKNFHYLKAHYNRSAFKSDIRSLISEGALIRVSRIA